LAITEKGLKASSDPLYVFNLKSSKTTLNLIKSVMKGDLPREPLDLGVN
jgi:hypothetical protein